MMKIQDAVLCCRERKATFARPVSWRGTAEAIDLGKWFAAEKTLQVAALRAEAVFGNFWNPSPEELLADWEVVTQEDLVREAGKSVG
jgi:hypothetical protein